MTENSLPNDWGNEELRTIAKINYGKSPALILSVDGQVPVVGTGGVERYGNDFLYDGESIVLGRKGTIDKVSFVDGKFWVIDTAYFLNEFNDTDVKWLYYFLQTVDLRGMNEATGVPSLSRDALYKIRIPKPTREEQIQIAAILSTIDKAIAQTEAIIAKQQRIKTGLMQDLLTRGIDEQGNIRSEATHAFKDSPLGRIPVEWKIERFGDVIQSAVDGPFGSNLKTEHYVAEPGVRVLRLQNIGNGSFLDSDQAWVSEEHANKLERHKVLAGDLLIASLGDENHPFGRACLYPQTTQPAIVKADVFRIRCKPNKLFHPFAFRLFNHFRWRKGLYGLAQGVTRDRVNLSNLKMWELPIPPVREQKTIAKHLDALDYELNELDRSLSKLRLTKTGLMQDLLAGRVGVTNLLKSSPVLAKENDHAIPRQDS